MKRDGQFALFALAMTFTLISLAACGGDHPLTRAEFISQANAICSSEHRKTGASERTAGVHESLKHGADRLVRELQYQDEMIADLGRLRVSRPEKAKLDKALALLEDVSQSVRKAIPALRRGDLSGVVKIAGKTTATVRKADRLFTALGTTHCVSWVEP
jgi:hypothetical protein